MRLAGKNIFITGSNRGMGKEFALCAARKKACVHLVNRKHSTELEEEIKAAGASSVRTWTVDQLELSQIDALAKKVAAESIDIDILINNAGLLTGGLLEKQDPHAIAQMLQVNLGSLIHLTRLLLPAMVERDQGLIVNNASVSGIMFNPCATTYCAAKAGVVGFTQALEQELRPTGVGTLLLITPGVKTEMFDEIYNLYEDHMDLSFLSAVSTGYWAEKVFEKIEKGENICLPTGQTRVGLWLARHLPSLFNYVMQKKYQRSK